MPASNVPWGAPALTRVPTIFPGQFGVPGTDSDTGLRLDSNGIILYVDPNHVDPSDQRDGTNPTAPLATVAEALTQCRAYHNDTIIVAPSAYWQHANVSVGRALPIAEEVIVTVPGVRIVGLMPSSSIGMPWIPVTDNGVCITVHAIDVLIEGFCFWNGGAAAVATPVAIKAMWNSLTGLYGDNLTVRHCFFENGLAYGIQLDFSYYCDIHRNHFEGCDVAAIHNLDVAGDPDYCQIHDNTFMNNIAAIDLEDTDNCFITRNYITGDATGTNNFIDLTGGLNNLVADNFLSCTKAQYDVTCSDAGSGAWLDNHCVDGSPVAPPT